MSPGPFKLSRRQFGASTKRVVDADEPDKNTEPNRDAVKIRLKKDEFGSLRQDVHNYNQKLERIYGSADCGVGDLAEHLSDQATPYVEIELDSAQVINHLLEVASDRHEHANSNVPYELLRRTLLDFEDTREHSPNHDVGCLNCGTEWVYEEHGSSVCPSCGTDVSEVSGE